MGRNKKRTRRRKSSGDDGHRPRPSWLHRVRLPPWLFYSLIAAAAIVMIGAMLMGMVRPPAPR